MAVLILSMRYVEYLEKARQEGDILIVAVNDDASVRRIKGDERPINPLSTRMRILSSLRSVDWVVSFSEDTPERIYSALVPDVLVKGGDYEVENVVGAKVVIDSGGAVKIIDFLAGHSTSTLINTIRDQAL